MKEKSGLSDLDANQHIWNRCPLKDSKIIKKIFIISCKISTDYCTVITDILEFHSELNNKLHANLYNNKLAWDSFEYLQKFIPSIHV